MDILTVIGVIAKVAAPKALSAAQRKERVGRALKHVGLTPGRPPSDFEGLYTYALVEYGVGRNSASLEIFRNQYLRAAFEKSLLSGDQAPIQIEADIISDQISAGEIVRNDYDDTRQIAAFQQVFQECIAKSRSAAEAVDSHKLDQIQEELESSVREILSRLDQTIAKASPEAIEGQHRADSRIPARLRVILSAPLGVLKAGMEAKLDRALADRGIRAIVTAREAHSDIATVAQESVVFAIFDEYDANLARQFSELRDLGMPCFVYVNTAASLSGTALAAFLARELSGTTALNTLLKHKEGEVDADDAARDIEDWISRRHRHITAAISGGRLSPTELSRSTEEAVWLRASVSRVLDQGSSLDLLHEQMLSWFGALTYELEAYEVYTDRSIDNIIHVPTRGGFDRILVRATTGQATSQDVSLASESVAALACDEAWIVVHNRVSKSAAQAIGETRQVCCYTFDELLDLDADFEPYLAWLEAEVRTRQIDTRYVPLTCTEPDALSARTSERWGRADIAAEGIEEYVGRWLDDPSKEHLSILGEFGTGKSWFSLHYAWKLAQEYRRCRAAGLRRPRIPLVVPLREYAKAFSVESMFSEFFFRKHRVRLPTYAAFEQLNRFGRLLLIFDGFDEMAARVDRQATINNFWSLARVVVPGSKALLTCRSEHFPNMREEDALLSAQLKASSAARIADMSPQFERVYLDTMEPGQIREMLSRRTDSETVERLLDNPELMDLLQRPVMSELVLDALPEVEAGEPVSLTHLYLYAIRRKMDRDIRQERTFTSLGDKVYFLSQLSVQMQRDSELSVNFREFPETIRRCFHQRVESAKDLDHWHYDMQAQTLLIRDADGDYSMAHRSFQEFFVAYALAAALGILPEAFSGMASRGEKREPAEDLTWAENFDYDVSEVDLHPLRRFRQSSLIELHELASMNLVDGAVAEMVAQMGSVDLVRSVKLVSAILKEAIRPSSVRSEALIRDLCVILMALDGTCLRTEDLSGGDWTAVDLSGFMGSIPSLDLSGANLSSGNFANADLSHVDLSGANLTSCQVSGAVGLPHEDCDAWEIRMYDENRVLAETEDSRLWTFDVSTGDHTSISTAGRVVDLPSRPNLYCPLFDFRGMLRDSIDLLDPRSLVVARSITLPKSAGLALFIQSSELGIYCDGNSSLIRAIDLRTEKEVWSLPYSGRVGLLLLDADTPDGSVVDVYSYSDDDLLRKTTRLRNVGPSRPPLVEERQAVRFEGPDKRSGGRSYQRWEFVGPRGEVVGAATKSRNAKTTILYGFDPKGAPSFVQTVRFSKVDGFRVARSMDVMALWSKDRLAVYKLTDEGGVSEHLRLPSVGDLLGADYEGSESKYESLGLSPDGRRATVSMGNGAIAALDFGSGRVLNLWSTSRHYRGANFSGVQGMNETVKSSLERLGATFGLNPSCATQ